MRARQMECIEANLQEEIEHALAARHRHGADGMTLDYADKLAAAGNSAVGAAPEYATDSAAFDFVGFSHFRAKSKKGVSGVRQVTAKSRYARALAAIEAPAPLRRRRRSRAAPTSTGTWVIVDKSLSPAAKNAQPLDRVSPMQHGALSEQRQVVCV